MHNNSVNKAALPPERSLNRTLHRVPAFGLAFHASPNAVLLFRVGQPRRYMLYVYFSILFNWKKLMKQYAAELLGTFWLVLGGCGSAVLAAAFPELGIGLSGVSLAFGLTVLTMAFAIGHISGCHLNPAVSVGLWLGGRFPAAKLAPYIVAQVLGAVAAAAVLYVIASGASGFDVSKGFASNGYGAHSPGGYSLMAALVTEVVMTMFFLLIILGATDKRAPQGFAPIAIGLALTLIHLISIPVTNTSVNPARSTGVALFVGDWAVSQLWLFWLAPIVGASLGALVYNAIGKDDA